MKKISKWILTMLLCAILAGNSVQVWGAAEESVNYYIYYVNNEETELEHRIYIPEKITSDFMLQDLMQRLNDKTEDGLIDLLPADVEMNSYKIEGEVLQIDFNGAYSDMSMTREILVRAGVVKTFLQISGISAVQFTVEGKDLLDSKDQPIGQMNAGAFVEFSNTDTDSYCYDTFVLYFTDITGKKLLEESRNVYYRRNIPKERVVLEQLAKGPMVKGHYPTISENTEVLAITTADDTCFVDVSQAFTNAALSNVSPNVVVYSLVDSLLATVDAERVQITVNGKEDVTLGDKVSLYKFFKKNTKLVQKEEQEE